MPADAKCGTFPAQGQCGAHALTGPIYVEEAQPGYMLEVHMRDFKFRVPYGVNYVIGEAVDDVLMVYGAIPKKLFTTNKPFWSKP